MTVKLQRLGLTTKGLTTNLLACLGLTRYEMTGYANYCPAGDWLNQFVRVVEVRRK